MRKPILRCHTVTGRVCRRLGKLSVPRASRFFWGAQYQFNISPLLRVVHLHREHNNGNITKTSPCQASFSLLRHLHVINAHGKPLLTSQHKQTIEHSLQIRLLSTTITLRLIHHIKNKNFPSQLLIYLPQLFSISNHSLQLLIFALSTKADITSTSL